MFRGYTFFVFFIAVLSTPVFTGVIELEPVGNGTVKISGQCTRDRQCIPRAFCQYQKNCMCDTFYAPSLDKATCHVTIGALCLNGRGCETMANGECRQNVCTCRDNFMIDINNSSNCIASPTRPGDICHRADDCRESMDMALCIDGKCKCLSDHYFANVTSSCVKKRGLYQPCRHHYECIIDEQRPNELECRDGECACRKGEPTCSKGSSFHYVPITTFAIIAAVTTLFPSQ